MIVSKPHSESNAMNYSPSPQAIHQDRQYQHTCEI
jgi:hypothetical protein